MIVDVIIPTYNSKDTILKTLFSIALQKTNFDFEVYLVNDCSSYDYYEYIDYFSAFFKIKEIRIEKNVGPGECRNIGMRSSHGDYIVFIDSDDYFYTPYSLKLLYESITKHDTDVVISDFIYERDNIRVIKQNDSVWLHGKIYKRLFLEENNISFSNTRANEDNGFNQLIFLLTDNVFYLKKITYVYAENDNSITRSNNRQYKLDGLEGFAYNIMWAIDEGITRNCDLYKATELSLKALLVLYTSYLELINDFDVSKIIIWASDLCKFYNSNISLISNDLVNDYLKLYMDNLYKNKEIPKKIISFSQFLNMVGDTHD